MDESKKEQVGSPNRDKFKQMHKKLFPGNFYASDLDFALIGRKGEIIAFLDYKSIYEPKMSERHNWTEIQLYSTLLTLAPVFIIRSDYPVMGPFIVSTFHPSVPYETFPVKLPTTTDLVEWETKLRNGRS